MRISSTRLLKWNLIKVCYNHQPESSISILPFRRDVITWTAVRLPGSQPTGHGKLERRAHWQSKMPANSLIWIVITKILELDLRTWNAPSSCRNNPLSVPQCPRRTLQCCRPERHHWVVEKTNYDISGWWQSLSPWPDVRQPFLSSLLNWSLTYCSCSCQVCLTQL
jgi:hypothetical protein